MALNESDRRALGGTPLGLLALVMLATLCPAPAPADSLADGTPSPTATTARGAGCAQPDRAPILDHFVAGGGQWLYNAGPSPQQLDELVARQPATTTTYEVLVDAAGHPHDVQIVHASQDPAKDRHTAQELVMHATFRPALHECIATAATFRSGWARVPERHVFAMAYAPRPANEKLYPSVPAATCSVPYRKPTVAHLVLPELAGSMKTFAPAVPWYGPSIRVQLNASGAVVSATVLRPSGQPAFDDATLAAAKQSTYTPWVLNCKPMPTVYTIASGLTDVLGP